MAQIKDMFLSILCRELVPWPGFEIRGMNATLELAKSIDEKENKLDRLQFPLLFSL